MPDDCIFCQIAGRKTDTEILYETDNLMVFRDLYPKAPVHLLIVPQRHIRSVNQLAPADAALVGELILAGQHMAAQFKIDQSGYKLLFNVEKGGGQVIFHLHLHLIGGWR
jgi:histidine triad (HIT) family protein